MFLNDRRKVSKSIRARIAIFASRAVTIDADCVLSQKTANARHLPRNKRLLKKPQKVNYHFVAYNDTNY